MTDAALSQSDSTFRDPAGSVSLTPLRVLRTVVYEHTPETLDFLATPLAHQLPETGALIATEVLANTRDGLLLEHPRVPFVSYPSEWPPSLWTAAAAHTLGLCTQLVGQGWILKDATPLNILFTGTRPVFVDLLSIRRTEATPIWFAYGQFVRTFLLPVLAHRQLGWRLQTAQTWRDGIEPEELYAALSWSGRLAYPARSFITLPVILAKLMKAPHGTLLKDRPDEPELIRRTLLNSLASLSAAIQSLTSSPGVSTWSHYAESAVHYSAEDHRAKRAFVTQALANAAPKQVLDIGANSGAYSRLAAAAGANVVAIDTDIDALERLYVEARAAGASILPLAVDLAFPTPATGWNNSESSSFLDRCENHFDTVLMLAVIHHLLLGAQIPLDRIASLAARITTHHLIIEWVPATDPKFIEVLRGRESMYRHLTEQAFRHAFAHHFTVAREATLNNGRILLHLLKL